MLACEMFISWVRLIFEISKHIHEAITLDILTVTTSIPVRGPNLGRLATGSVWQHAVKRQPGSRAEAR